MIILNSTAAAGTELHLRFDYFYVRVLLKKKTCLYAGLKMCHRILVVVVFTHFFIIFHHSQNRKVFQEGRL